MTYTPEEVSSLKRHWLRSANIPQRFLGLEPSDVADKVGAYLDEVARWDERALSGLVIKNTGDIGITGVGILFDGKPGRGKTTLALITLMEFLRNLPNEDKAAREILGMSPEVYGMAARPAYYMTFPEFLSRKKALIDADADSRAQLFREMEGFHGRCEDDRLNVRLLVIDDVGKEYGSKYDDTSFDELLRSRYDKSLPTLMTTNIPREQWDAQYGAAMGSFAHEAFYHVRMIGEDLRKQ
jgi:DNA replication protein DnaC